MTTARRERKPRRASRPLEDRVIAFLILGLAIIGLVFVLRKDGQARKAMELARTHEAAAQKVREEKSGLEDEVLALRIARKKPEDIAAALDAAPRLIPGDGPLQPTRTLRAGDIFTAGRTVHIVDPIRSAEAAAALTRAEAKAALLASCQTVRDGFEKERDQERLRALKWKARFPWGIVIGAGVATVAYVAIDKPWRK